MSVKTPCAIPEPKLLSNTLDCTVSPTTKEPTTSIKNNSVTLNAPAWKFSILSTMAVADDVNPWTVLDSNLSLVSSVIILNAFSVLKLPDDGLSKSTFGV